MEGGCGRGALWLGRQHSLPPTSPCPAPGALPCSRAQAVMRSGVSVCLWLPLPFLAASWCPALTPLVPPPPPAAVYFGPIKGSLTFAQAAAEGVKEWQEGYNEAEFLVCGARGMGCNGLQERAPLTPVPLAHGKLCQDAQSFVAAACPHLRLRPPPPTATTHPWSSSCSAPPAPLDPASPAMQLGTGLILACHSLHTLPGLNPAPTYAPPHRWTSSQRRTGRALAKSWPRTMRRASWRMRMGAP